MQVNKRALAIFDFDKTLITVDSFRLFSLTAADTWWKRVLVFVLAVLCKFRIIDNAHYKLSVLRLVWAGREKEQKSRILKALYRSMNSSQNAQTVSLMLDHLNRNDEVVIISASPDFYLRPYVESSWSNIRVFASDYQEHDGKFFLRNMYREEKANCARKLSEDLSPGKVVLYTDHISDAPLMKIADLTKIVRPSKRICEKLNKMGVKFVAVGGDVREE